MRIAFFLSGLGSGGIYNQTKGLLKLIKNLELDKFKNEVNSIYAKFLFELYE